MHRHKQYKQWSEQEDDVIKKLVEIYGTKQWAVIAQEMQKRYGYKNRTGKQCRERWHNHLDPSINKEAWESEEERVMFQEHGKHGNKWTVIAERLPGRNDNAIKNHFYSTVRRSIRRISKILGSKNSTHQMRSIKPSTLSKIFSIVTGNDSEYSMLPSAIPPTDHPKQTKQNDQNSAAYKLKLFLSENCQNLAQNIMEFANYKPTKKNSQVLKKNSKKRSKKHKEDESQSESQELNEQFQSFKGIIDKIIRINFLYEKAQIVQRRKRRQFLQSRGKDFDEFSDEGDIEEFDEFTPQNMKVPLSQSKQRRFSDNFPNLDQQISEQIINLPKQSIRSKRQIKTPTFYEPVIKIRQHGKPDVKVFVKNINQKIECESKKQTPATKSSILSVVLNQIHNQQAIFESENPFKGFEIEDPNSHPNDEIQYPLQYQSFVISEIPELAWQIPQISIRQDSGEQGRMDLLSPRAYSPYFSFPTPTGLTPKGSLFREKSNLSSFGSIGFNNEDLDNYVNAFKKETECNMESYDKQRERARQRERERAKQSSYLAPSPKSAFKLYQ